MFSVSNYILSIDRHYFKPILCNYFFRSLMSRRIISLNGLQSQQDEADGLKPIFISRKKRKQLLDAPLSKLKPEGVKSSLNVTSATSSPEANTKNDIKSHNRSHLRPKDDTSSTSIDKKKRKTNQFVFEWDPNEDTMGDYEVLVEHDHEEEEADSIIKDVHWSSKELSKMTERDWRIVREDYGILVKAEGPVAPPLRRWGESDIPSAVVEHLEQQLKLKEPSPIQRASIPVALSNRDVLGIAETGSGKTLAFLVPFFSLMLNQRESGLVARYSSSSSPSGLVLAPTRELALQISEQASTFAKAFNFTVLLVIGGHQYEETILKVEKHGVDLVVATPGRLVDILEQGIINLRACHLLVLDEADRMVDMGFEQLLVQIMNQLPKTPLPGRSRALLTLMFTATITPTIDKIAEGYLDQPVRLVIGNVGEAVDRIEQRFMHFDVAAEGTQTANSDDLDPKRQAALIKAIGEHSRRHKDYSIILFANFKRTCEAIAMILEQQRYRVCVVHGSKSQEARERALTSFRNHESKILVATDVAARGIDVPSVSLVVNFQMPRKFEEYVHRIGRTGRAGSHGESLAFVDKDDGEIYNDLRRFLLKSKRPVPRWLQDSFN